MNAGSWVLLMIGLSLAPASQAQTAPKPVGSIGQQLLANSYPPAALRVGAEGRVIVSLTIDASGYVRRCDIEETSGNADLDAGTCRNVQRVRFTPARNEQGRAVPGRYRLPVRWSLPKIAPSGAVEGQTLVKALTEVRIAPDGTIMSCKVLERVGLRPDAIDPCREDAPGKRDRVLVRDGRPTGYTLTKSAEWTLVFDN